VTLSETRGRLLQYSAESPDHARIASSALQSVENSLKGFGGRRLALVDQAGFARVAAAEADLQSRVRRNAAAVREIGDPWAEIAAAQQTYRGFFYSYQYLEASAATRSDLFAWARDIVRGTAEREKPNAERLPRYAEARLSAVEQSIRADRPVERSFEELNLSIWLSKLREYLTNDDPLTARVLGRASPEQLAARLSQSRLADPAYRAQLWEGGAAAVAASDDPMIVFVRSWDADARALRARYVREVEGPVARAQERIARARFRAFGSTQYPDATFSPRVSYGRIRGWTEAGGREIQPMTRVSGLYQRATGDEPYRLTQRWLDARSRLDGNVIYNVTSTNDIIGGNSGSPLLDREGRVIGAAFDGNIHSLGGEYFYDGNLNRMVSVTSAAMRLALTEVYDMDWVVAEMDAQ
jgi:hypothetical protein